MKENLNKILFPISLVLLTVTYSCKKTFLDVTPLGQLNASTTSNASGVQTLLTGAYHMLLGTGGAAGTSYQAPPSNWILGGITSDDAYKGSQPSDQGLLVLLETWAYNADNVFINSKWQALYDGAQRSNEVLRIMAIATDISAADQKTIAAEARFLRGYFHFEAKKIWNYVPYVDETVTVASNNVNVSNLDASGNFVDIWPKIEGDLKFAMDNLPETQPLPGKANKWAAAAFLLKVYLFEHKYPEAKTMADMVIASGKTAKGDKYALVNFESNFNAATDNSAESVFAVQNAVNDGSTTNGNAGDQLNYPSGTGPVGCCGFYNPSISLANSFKTDPANGLPLFNNFNSGPNVSDPVSPYSGTLDPRIDWTMGRPGIAYLDWGVHSLSWLRDQPSNGWFSPKKTMYAKSQQGIFSYTGSAQTSAINTNLIRFADVLLMAAEAEIEAGTADKAMQYVNRVRTRAQDAAGWVYKNSTYTAANGTYADKTTPADNYKIGLYAAGSFSDKIYALTAIRFERKIELAMEGHRFFDLQRWDNGSGTVMAPTLNAYAAVEKTRPSIFKLNSSAQFTAQKNEYYPIPQSQIDVANSQGTVVLKQNPKY